MDEGRKLKAHSSRWIGAAGLLVLGLLLGLGMSRGSGKAGAEDKRAASNPPSESPFVRVAEDVLPAVVSVEAIRTYQHPPVEQDSTDEEPSPFGSDGQVEIPSSGSGFIFDREGHILTNNHVVSGARSIQVRLADGRSVAATLVGTDPATDVAVLKIDVPGTLPMVPLGDSDALRIGEWVAAVGNPLGVLEGSLTVGVVSAKKRNEIDIGGSSPAYQDFIQTDAAINFGNSGGPLVNTRGEAVGINTAFGGPGRGLGFAVSINMAKEVARGLMAAGHIIRGYLGVGLQQLDPYLVEGMKLPDSKGVLVRDVQPNTPAERAGLLAGDVIIAFDGAPVEDLAAFRLLVARTPVGRSVGVDFRRGGLEKRLSLELAARPDFEQEAATPPVPEVEPVPELGLTLGVLADQGQLGEPADTVGVLVKEVAPSGLAEEAGLSPGDLILEIDGRAVKDPDICLRALQDARGAHRVAVLWIKRVADHWFVAMPFSGSPSR